MKKKMSRISYLLFLLGLVILWHILALGRESLIFPSPLEVLFSVASIVRSRIFSITVFNTVKDVLFSFAAAFVPALLFGIAGKFVPFLYNMMDNLSGIIRSVPTVSIILIALLLLPVHLTPIVICFFVVFPVLYTNVAEGLVNVDDKLLEMARVYRIKRRKIIREIYVPSLKAYLVAGSRTALGLSFKIIVTAEVFNFVSQHTIGAQMYMHKIHIDLAGIIAWTIIVVVLSLLFDALLKRLFERRRTA